MKNLFAVTQCRAIRNAALALGLTMCLLGVSLPSNAQGPKIITLDAPGAVGTIALAINPAGTVTGIYSDANNTTHAFVRAADGTITTFDAPGAGTGAFQGTSVVGINPAGEITGSVCDAILCHGYLRAPNGTFTTFDAPGATAGLIGTFPSNISSEGVVTGNFFDANFVTHGFLRARNGTITTFDDPNAGTGPFEGTSPMALNPQGAIVGCYVDANLSAFSFLRSSAGTFSSLTPPGGFSSFFGCFSIFSGLPNGPMAINAPGVISGAYFQPLQNFFGGNVRGFVRALDGSFQTFDDVPSPSTPCCTWTFPTSINSAGEIVGYDNDFNSVDHGFLRAPNGYITRFDAPGAGLGPPDDKGGTVPASINPAGVIAGYFVDANFVLHGFLRTP